MSQSEDILLISQVKLLGSRRAFDSLVRKYQGALRRMLIGLSGGDTYMVDDIAQDTFIRAWTYIGTYRMHSSFKTWLYAIAYRVFYDYTTRMSCYKHSSLDEISPHMTQEMTYSDLSMDVQKALMCLRYEERTAIVLCYMEGYSYKEISQVMSLPQGTVKSLIHRGKEHLSIILKK
ncbi:MAG: RNA polymerase sigma factor [Flavobacteriales bacterium]|nr:RNA polymerase sigma factor [Flavobacteriales bacterium]